MPELRFEGTKVPIHDGDTIASALHRAGILELGRSLKYHRPRGVYCNTGSCAGCTVAVDGVPNVPACMSQATPGARVESQNTMGSAKRDLLAITDKVYRKGFDPHGAFTKPRLLNKAFLKAVRFMSGVGTVPGEDVTSPPANFSQRNVDVLVIGAGRAGLSHALEQADSRDVLLIDDLPELGGSATWDPAEQETHALVQRVREHPRIDVWSQSLAFGIYDDEIGVMRGRDLVSLTAKQIIICPGGHDDWPLFENNDLPGVLSLRGAWRLLGQDALPGKRVVVSGDEDARFASALRDAGGEVVAAGSVDAVRGGTRVEKARVNGAWVACDAVVCNVQRNPRIELFQQAGCALGHGTGVLAPVVDGHGRTTRKDIIWGNA